MSVCTSVHTDKWKTCHTHEQTRMIVLNKTAVLHAMCSKLNHQKTLLPTGTAGRYVLKPVMEEKEETNKCNVKEVLWDLVHE